MSSFVNTIGFADFKSVLESLWVVDECQSLHYLIPWTIQSFSSSLFLFMVNFSCRRGKLDIITILSFPLRDTLSIICQGNFSIIWQQVAASDLMPLCGMHLIGTLNWCALLSRYTMPYAVWRVYVCHLCVFFACFFPTECRMIYGGSGKLYVAGRASVNHLTATSLLIWL